VKGGLYGRFIQYCIGLNVADILPSDKKKAIELTELQNRFQAIDGEILDIGKRLENVYDTIERASNPTVKKDLSHRASAFVIRREKLEEEKKETQSRITNLLNSATSTEEQLKSIRELIDKMKSLEGDKRLSLRLNLRNQLRRLIKQIKIDLEDNAIRIAFQSGQSTSIYLDRTGPLRSITRTKLPILRNN
jgi:uncharacterized protein (UPF0335 family)